MIRSLRWRLILAIVLITLAASTLVGVGLGRFTRSEFQQFLEVEAQVESIQLPPTGELVEALRGGVNGTPQEVLTSLSKLAGDARLLLFSPENQLIGDTDPVGDVLLREDGELEIRRVVEADGETREERMSLRGGVPLGGPQAPLGTRWAINENQW